MTQKELLYVEDALEHEKSIIKICNESIKILQDEELITFLESEIIKHTDTQERLTNLLEAKTNG